LKRFFIPTALFVMSMALSVSVFAKDRSTDVQIYQTTQVGSATLQPGTYHVKVNLTESSSTVSFSQNGKQVADVQGQTVQLARKATDTSVTLDNSGTVPRIAEIDFEGQQTAVGFSSPAATATAGE
jgi:hypothetical protein